jgi:signal transduction histidine kinase
LTTALTAGLATATAAALTVAVVVATVGGSDRAQLVLLAGGAAGGVGLAGAAGLRLLRHRPLGVQAATVALTGVLAVAGGAWAAANAMFVSTHDLEALGVVLAVAGVVAIAVALLLGRRVGRASRSLVDVARRIGRGEAGVDAGRPATTELAALAQELERMSAQLEAARDRERALETSRRELVAWVSHDLRTPLAAVRAMAEALEDGVVSDPDTVARYHRQLGLEVDRLAGLVDDLFELSRTQAGVVELHLEPVALGDLISDALAGAAPVAQAKGVRLEGRLDGHPPDLALSTPEVARALRNLLENAIRHTPADGTVRVEAGVDDGHAYVAVADACGGIPPPDLDRVFDVAFRGEAARSPGHGSGAGLGLAIARGMVEAHGGELTVGNEGPGCRFVVRLPLEAR